MTTAQQAARAAYAEDLTGPEWADLRGRLAAQRRGRRCAAHGRRCRGGPRQAHHWSRRFYQVPIWRQQTWMLVMVCRRGHRVIHALSWLSALGKDRLTWLPLWTVLIIALGRVWWAVATTVTAVRTVPRP